jgi:hypothetical protein
MDSAQVGSCWTEDKRQEMHDGVQTPHEPVQWRGPPFNFKSTKRYKTLP